MQKGFQANARTPYKYQRPILQTLKTIFIIHFNYSVQALTIPLTLPTRGGECTDLRRPVYRT